MKLIILFFALLPFSPLIGQPWPVPELPDTTSYGQYTSPTMHLLQTSTKENPNTVKILVYGQSISVQDWWLRVKSAIEEQFPNAKLIMENKAIGGFASQILCKTVEMDVSAFYPDLVLLHIYGSHTAYDAVLHAIRSRTAAEIAIQTDHFTGENAWSDTMSYHLLPALGEKYKCDLINIRDPWKKYLLDHGLNPKDLLRDDVHLNTYGEFVMAELIKPLFTVKPKYPADPFGLCTAYIIGKDVSFEKGTLTLPFTGNRAVVSWSEVKNNTNSPMRVLVDNSPPSSFTGTYFMTRPYAASGKDWPWDLPAMVRIQRKVPWVAEEWTCTFTEVAEPYDDFGFSIMGSVTGFDGAGKGGADFESNSGRVIINKGDAENGGDWHLHRSYQVKKTRVEPGSAVNWKTYSISTDILAEPSEQRDPVILFQGIPNTAHILNLQKTQWKSTSPNKILIYQPLLKDE